MFDGWCYHHACKHIVIGKKLGSGYNGSVFECKLDGVTYALKLFKEGRTKSIEREKKALRKLRHENIVVMHRELRYRNRHGHLLEHVPKDLFSYVEDGPPVVKAPIYLRQLVSGLAYIHSQGYIYRDVKAENCLITSSDVLKICDFDTVIKADTYDAKHMLGTVEYLAPEIVIQHPRCTNKVDIWAVGVMAYELYSGEQLFHGDNPAEILHAISKMKWEMRKGCPVNLNSFIKLCIQKDPTKRPTARELLKHIYLRV